MPRDFDPIPEARLAEKNNKKLKGDYLYSLLQNSFDVETTQNITLHQVET